MTFVAGRNGSGGARLPSLRLLPGDHACWFVHSPEEHRQGVTAFVRQGLERGGKVVYQADTSPLDTVAGYLRLAGLDPDGLVARGKLVLLSPADRNPSEGASDQGRPVGLYGHLLEQVREEGLRGLWLTVERTRETRSDILEEERYLEEERLVEGFAAAGEDAVFLCQYNASVVKGRSADALRSVHDLEFVEARLRPLGGNLPQLEVSPTDDGIALSGEVDLGSWAILRDALMTVAGGAEGEDVILDVAGLSFMDGHGMSLIAQATRELGPSKRLVVRGATPTLIRAAEILGFDRQPGLVIEGSGLNGDG